MSSSIDVADRSCLGERVTGRISPDGLTYDTVDYTLFFAGHFLDHKKALKWSTKLGKDGATTAMVPGGIDEPAWILFCRYPPNTGGFRTGNSTLSPRLPGGFSA